MKITHMIAFILVMIGALNWGIIGLGTIAGFNGDIVKMLLGSWPTIEAAVYILVGLSAIFLMATHKKECSMCMAPVKM